LIAACGFALARRLASAKPQAEDPEATMSHPTRRRFLQAAALGAALPLAADAAQDPPSPEQSLLAIVRHRFRHMSEDQLKAVTSALQRGITAAEVLKRTRLSLLDEPATVFVADVAE
jgi:hypothetical protein